jgi:serine/threonine protein kinase
MIGKGGIGRVFLAKHRNTGFYFALKIIKKADVKDIDQLAFGIKCHFLLNHPNLAQLYACFSD